ncbi:MAG: hypothetical protein K8L97_10215 [Anaerolineae bacterium]|nr:hypothetical protein [Anaerolineae bacterium]
MKVLIGYASAHGSTAEVAHAIGRVLLENDIQVKVADVRTVGTVEEFDAFILGSAVHAGTWLPEMSSFLKGYHDQFLGKPIYLFVTCIRVMEQHGFDHVMEYYMIPELLTKLNIQDKIAFAGKLKLEEVDWNERWTLAARYDGATWPSTLTGDFRDWEKIRGWAAKIVENLQIPTRSDAP